MEETARFQGLAGQSSSRFQQETRDRAGHLASSSGACCSEHTHGDMHHTPPSHHTHTPPNPHRKKPCISNRVNKHNSYRDDCPLPRCEWWTRRSCEKQVAMLVEDPLWQPQGTHPLAGMGRRERAQWPFPDTRADEEAGAAVGRRWGGSPQWQLELKISNDL